MSRQTGKIYLKNFDEQMLDKYPNMYKVQSCSVCKTDLRYLKRIHRLDMDWYCNKCYMKYGVKHE